VFETFPEGVAIIRNNMVLYANKSLYHLLEVKNNALNSAYSGLEDFEFDNLK
jgi:hypothetical protein